MFNGKFKKEDIFFTMLVFGMQVLLFNFLFTQPAAAHQVATAQPNLAKPSATAMAGDNQLKQTLLYKWFAWHATSGGDAADRYLTEPELAFSAKGDAVAVWSRYDEKGHSYFVVANHYSAKQHKWGDAELIQANRKDYTYGPKVAMDDGGNAVATWEQLDKATGIYFVTLNAYDSQRGKWGAATRVNKGDKHGENPAVAMSGAGQAMVLWTQDSPAGGHYAVMTSNYSLTTGQLSKPIEIQRAHQPHLKPLYPQAMASSQGDLMAVWLQYNPQAKRYSIESNHYDSTSRGWMGAITVKANLNFAQNIQLKTNAMDKVQASWEELVSGGDEGDIVYRPVKSEYSLKQRKWVPQLLAQSSHAFARSRLQFAHARLSL